MFSWLFYLSWKHINDLLNINVAYVQSMWVWWFIFHILHLPIHSMCERSESWTLWQVSKPSKRWRGWKIVSFSRRLPNLPSSLSNEIKTDKAFFSSFFHSFWWWWCCDGFRRFSSCLARVFTRRNARKKKFSFPFHIFVASKFQDFCLHCQEQKKLLSCKRNFTEMKFPMKNERKLSSEMNIFVFNFFLSSVFENWNWNWNSSAREFEILLNEFLRRNSM